ncbi:MAG: type II toxin-antitoxin system RelE/ParE family toxin [Desulfobacteraceae bacterium]|nr:type II toxin-antitoxin system RelE/ParE family toxin [Desulfobacteraceae bacterium]
MAEYKIFFKKSVWKDFKSIPDKDLTKILSCIEMLGMNPRKPGAIKLSGKERYRFRLGNYRIIYSIHDDELTIWIIKIGHRKNVY